MYSIYPSDRCRFLFFKKAVYSNIYLFFRQLRRYFLFCNHFIIYYITFFYNSQFLYYIYFNKKITFRQNPSYQKNRAADLSRLPCIKYLKLSVSAVISLKCKPLSCFRSIQPRSQVLPTGILRGYKFCHFQYRLPNQGCILSRLHMRHRN